MKTQQRITICEQANPTRPHGVGALILPILASKTVKNAVLLFESCLVYDILFLRAKWTKKYNIH